MEHQLKIYDSLSREKKLFVPLNPPFVGMYSCGPTVYNEVHLGNLRTFTTFDVVYRYLTHIGYKVRYVRNITDAGHLTNDAGQGVDRIEESAKLEQLEPMEIVQKYTNSFHEVCNIFNILSPSIEPTATGHIIEQIEMIKRILENGYAYEINGSVYFDVRKFMEKHEYGKLSGRNIDELMEGSRELDGQEEKKNPVDFAIWKAVAPNHIQRWQSPWGEGIPGWHLECSAMGTKYLGRQFDIHGGGMDLKFPHHECEIAQSVGADGVQPVRYWMHANMLTVNGDKMSKSKGNSFLPRELFSGSHPLLEKAYAPMAVRFFMLQAHYRSTLDFTNEALQAAEKGFARLMNAYKVLGQLQYVPGATNPAEIDEVNKLCKEVYEKMDDDFNTAEAIAVLFEMAKKINSYKEGLIPVSGLDETAFNKLKTTFNAFIKDILAIDKEAAAGNADVVDGLMDLILDLRKDVRAKKDFAASDKIRDQLVKLGITVKDGKEGTSWTAN
ncbi:MAG TPA: cysteine--tRNA ligase [Chitinophagales bacterium]|nr:cysteine--tRNA ligase [Chitinophagales bacterium]